jgi:hypothetical protein
VAASGFGVAAGALAPELIERLARGGVMECGVTAWVVVPT